LALDISSLVKRECRYRTTVPLYRFMVISAKIEWLWKFLSDLKVDKI
jgi:hypothetical protein